MCSACIPIFVGGASPVSEIFLLLNLTNFPFLTMTSMVGKKLNHLELVQKIYASRG